MPAYLRFHLGLLFCVWCTGCQQATTSPATPATQAKATQAATSEAAAASTAPTREYWDAIYFGDSHVGFSHTTYEDLAENDKELVKISCESEIAIQRFGETTRQKLRYTSIEEKNGEVVRFTSSMSTGNAEASDATLDAEGTVVGEDLELRLTTAGKTQTAKIPWQKSWGGYFATEQVLAKSPLKPGDKRVIQAITPGFNQTAELEFVAEQPESVATLDGNQELLRIASKVKLGTNVLEQSLWVDANGQIIKSAMPALQQVSYRTTKEKAVRVGQGSFDLGAMSIVKPSRAIPQPHQTRRVTYRASLATGDPRNAFWNGATQFVRPIDSKTVEIVVRSLRKGDESGTEFPPDSKPTDADLASNSFIQSDDKLIEQMADQATKSAAEPWDTAIALEKYVRETIKNKNFSQALSSAAEVAKSREGDCTEHAVLLAALCRAKRIPARVNVGLVYYAPSEGFAYHMWTSAWIDDRWIPLDGTIGQGGIGACHLTVSQSNMDGVDPLTQLLPVMQLIGNLKLDIVEIVHR